MPGPTAPLQSTSELPAERATNGDVLPTHVGVLDFYRAIAETAIDAGRRYRLPMWSAIALAGVYFGLRTIDANADQMTIWLWAVIALCFLSPVSGLVVLAAIAPFNEGIEGVAVSGEVGSKSAIAVALVLAIGLRWLVVPTARTRPSAPVVLALLLLVTAGLGLIRTLDRWGTDFATLAAGTWIQGVATMLLVFVATVWIARSGARGPLLAAMIATTVAGIVSLVDYWGDAAIRDSALGWVTAGQYMASRLTGVIRSPTSTAALVMLPLCVYLAAVFLAPMTRLRIAAAAVTAPLLLAAYLTYNRAVFIALYVLAVIVGWRIGRRLGMALLIVGIVLGVALVPWYVSLRGQALGPGATLQPGQLLVANDQQRLEAWAAAGRMFLDEPLLGQGYRAFRQLAVQYGVPVVNAPHNEWLRFFAEHGILIGLLGLAWLGATAIRLARAPGWLGAGLFGSFLSLAIAASFNNVFLFNQVTIPAMVMAGTGLALSRPPTPAVREDA